MSNAFILRHRAASAVFAVALVGFFATAHCEGGLLFPDELKFDHEDLERALNDKTASGTSSRVPVDAPCDDGTENQRPELINTAMPSGNSSSSSSSSSSSGGVFGSGLAICISVIKTVISDDAVLGRLTEDHGLFLPDPPGTDLLRPPQV